MGLRFRESDMGGGICAGRHQRSDPARSLPAAETRTLESPGTAPEMQGAAILPASESDARSGQRPLNTGGRFSRNARSASLWSSVSWQRIMPMASVSSASDKPPSSAARMLRFM